MLQTLHFATQEISIYNLMVALGVGCGVFLALWQAGRLRLDDEQTTRVIAVIPYAFLFGTVTGYLSFKWFYFEWPWDVVYGPARVGFTYFGWFLGAVMCVWVYSKIVKIPFWFLLNFHIPSFAVAQALGRIGCFFGGCCYGKPCVSGWGVVFPENSPAWLHYGETAIWPVQGMEAVCLLGIFFFLWRVDFHRRSAWYFVLYPGSRFLLEFLRGDDRGSLLGLPWFSPAQWLSLVLLIFGVGLLYVTHDLRRKK